MNESEFLISAHLQLYATFNLFFGLTSIIFLVKSVCKFFFFFPSKIGIKFNVFNIVAKGECKINVIFWSASAKFWLRQASMHNIRVFKV